MPTTAPSTTPPTMPLAGVRPTSLKWISPSPSLRRATAAWMPTSFSSLDSLSAFSASSARSSASKAATIRCMVASLIIPPSDSSLRLLSARGAVSSTQNSTYVPCQSIITRAGVTKQQRQQVRILAPALGHADIVQQLQDRGDSRGQVGQRRSGQHRPRASCIILILHQPGLLQQPGAPPAGINLDR